MFTLSPSRDLTFISSLIFRHLLIRLFVLASNSEVQGWRLITAMHLRCRPRQTRADKGQSSVRGEFLRSTVGGRLKIARFDCDSGEEMWGATSAVCLLVLGSAWTLPTEPGPPEPAVQTQENFDLSRVSGQNTRFGYFNGKKYTQHLPFGHLLNFLKGKYCANIEVSHLFDC